MNEKLKIFFSTNIIVWIVVAVLYIYFIELSGLPAEIEQNKITLKLVIVNSCLLFSLMSAIFVWFEEIRVIFNILLSNKTALIYSLIASIIIMMYALTGMLNFASGSALIEKAANALIILIILQPVLFLIKDKFKNSGIICGLFMILFGIGCFIFFLLGGQKFPDILNKKNDGITPNDLFLLAFCSFLILLSGWLELEYYVKKIKLA